MSPLYLTNFEYYDRITICCCSRIVLSKVQVTAKKAKVDEEEAEKRRKANRPPKEVIGIRKGEPLPDNGKLNLITYCFWSLIVAIPC